MTQTPPPQQGTMMNTPPGNVTTEQIQKYLDENRQLIMAILEHQKVGNFAECSSLQSQLQENLTYLAKVADAQPPPSQPQETTCPPPPQIAQMAPVQQEQQQQQQQQQRYIQASQGQIEWPQQQQPMYLQAPRHPFQMNDPKQQQQQQQQQQLQRSYLG